MGIFDAQFVNITKSGEEWLAEEELAQLTLSPSNVINRDQQQNQMQDFQQQYENKYNDQNDAYAQQYGSQTNMNDNTVLFVYFLF